MSPVLLHRYLDAFSQLRRNANKTRGAAPHKPILLLAILHELDQGRITENVVGITPELVSAFQTFWTALVPEGSGWDPQMNNPFRHLASEGFWTLVRGQQPITIEGTTPTLNQLAQRCDGGRFADELWSLLQDAPTRAVFRRQLLTTYFPQAAEIAAVQADTSVYLTRQAEALRREAQARFRIKRIAEPRDDGYYVRSRLFPKVIKELYGFSCCVCGVSARQGESSLIDGAHILPFAEFHNDDPRNGLALCKNHHWGFDQGMWSLTDEAKVLVSARLQNSAGYLEAGKAITLPKEKRYRPDPLALQWHRGTYGF